MIKQNTPYGCGMYATANALDMPEFVSADRLEKSKTGNNIAQLTLWLAEDWAGYGLDILYYDIFGEILPSKATGFKPLTQGEIFPILIEVQKNKESRNHLIGGQIDTEGILTVFDSLKEEPFKTTLAELNEYYFIVKGIYAFHYIDGRGWLMLLKGETNGI